MQLQWNPDLFNLLSERKIGVKNCEVREIGVKLQFSIERTSSSSYQDFQNSGVREIRIVPHFYSGGPVAEGRHEEPHTDRTHAFIFSWSSLSAAYGLRAPTNGDDDDDVAQHGAYTGQPMYAYAAYTSAI